ncbi:haloacid dehalogenase-like domain-containing protein [Tanacetum coccineum]
MAVEGFEELKRKGDGEPESDIGDLKKLKTNEDEEIGLEKKNAASEKGSDQEKLKEMVAQGGQNSTKVLRSLRMRNVVTVTLWEFIVHLDISTLIMVHKISSMVYGACAYQIAAVIVLKQREGDDEHESDRGDLKKLKTDEDEEAGQEKQNATTLKILAEYTKSESSSCTKCSEMIELDSIRLGLSSWDPQGFETTKWHHIDCFFPLDADLASAESIEGFSDLKSSDQEKLKKLVTGVDQPATSSSTESSSPQHTPFPSFAQCASQQPHFPQENFQMNQHAFDQMALFQLQQQYPFNLGALGNTSQQPQTTQQPQSPQTTQLPNSNSSSQTSHTKSSSPARKGNGKARVRKPRPKKTDIIRTPWSQKEEKLLAETWLQVSEDPRLGVDQEKKMCWQKVLSEYNRHASFKRTKDMITGKWATLTRDCNKFAAIVAQYERLGGENESTWVTRCYKHFQEIWGVAFVHHEAWEVLKGHSKWRDTKASVPERRVRTDDDVEDPNELFQNDPQPRPLDKPRLSKSKKSDSTPMVGSSSSREAFKEMVQENLRQYRAKKVDLIATRIKLEELKFLTTSIAGLSEEDAKLINKYKEEIRAKYRTNGRDPKPGRRPDICPRSSPMKTPLPPPSSYDRPPEDEEEDDENIEEAEDPEQGAT